METEIERLRLRLRESPSASRAKERWDRYKSNTSLAISCVALGISMLTAFFAVVRQADDIRAVIRGPVFMEQKDDKIEVNSELSISIINAGNRPVVLLDLEFRVRTSLSAESYGCDVARFETHKFADVHASTLKPGEAVTVPLRFPKNSESVPKLTISGSNEAEYFVVGCVAMSFSTPTEVLGDWTSVVDVSHFVNGAMNTTSGYNEPRVPKTVYKRLGTIFFD